MGIIEKAEPGQFPMVDLVQALIVSVKMHYYKQIEGEHYGEGDVENDQR
jgi:exosome complex RNA-binding protein Csl4